LAGNKTVRLTLNGISHTFPGDIDALLVGPAGQKFIVMSDAANSLDAVNANTNLVDTAAAGLPSVDSTINGTFKPTDHTSGDTFAAPAPTAPYLSAAPVGSATFATAFGTAGSALNGTWTLYLMDDAGVDTGEVDGWSLTFEANDYECNVSSVRSRADFDGDGKTDLSVFRPSEGNWYLNRSSGGFGVIGWGVSTDILAPGDYDGDGKTDTAVYRPNADPAVPDFYILNSNGFTVSGVSWGTTGDIQVTADYDADAKTDVAVFRPSSNTWYVLKSGGGFDATVFGQAGDVPVAGNFGGTAGADLTVYRSGTWMSQLSGGGTLNHALGAAGDVLVPADYSGDNVDDFAIYRPSTGTWMARASSGPALPDVVWGNATDVPVPGDYDGDGKDDVAIYRNGQWWIDRSTAGVLIANFGVATDKAIPRQYVP
jgi:subtilisin-like proprotein convertase family protein